MNAVDWIVGIVVVLTGLCVAVWILAACFGIALIVDFFKAMKRRRVNNLYRNLPLPDRAAERMYGQQYFDRAVKKD